MIFSTIPTAAASVRPRRLAMIGDDDEGYLDEPSCTVTGMPIAQQLSHHRPRRAAGHSCWMRIPMSRRRMTKRDTATLTVWASVVPRAAPAGPKSSAPMNK